MGARISALAVLIAVAAAVIVIVSGSGSSHDLIATFDSATNLVSGARVSAGGQQVGSVGSVKLENGLAAVQLNITDKRVWPLRQGTHAEIRWGGTVSYSNRYVELLPGPAKDPVLPSGSRLPTSDTVTPVEFDQLFNVFSAPARKSLGDLAGNGASSFGSRAGEIKSGLNESGPALNSVAGVLNDLGADPNALETLVGTGASAAQALRDQQSQLVGLVSNAASIFNTIADRADQTEQTLSKLPPALSSAQDTLARLDPSLTKLNTVVSDIKPGAVKLRDLAAPLGQAITTLGTVAPELNGTLADVQKDAPQITSLLNTAKPVIASATPALNSLEPMAACVLPYAPEIAGFISTWQSMGSYYDAVGHYARVLGQVFPFIDDDPSTPAKLVSGIANLGYALIRPPGYGADQTWLQPQCGAGASAIDPADDPEPG
jgi:phospholipid/cholesterol/gamma-HCH transport system substrate-binding protein